MSTIAPSSQFVKPLAPSLEVLIADARGGDEGALRQLMEQHVDFVRSFLVRYVSDPGAIDDLCQETFITMHRMLPTFRQESKFSTWLLGISRNLALTYIRDQTRRQRREATALDVIAQWQSDHLEQLDSDAAAAHLQQLGNLRDCIGGLSPSARAMVDAYYFENEKAEAIAKRLRRKSGAVRMTLLRIRKALAACLESKAGDDVGGARDEVGA